MSSLFKAIKAAPIRHPVIGGSSFGSLDHITLMLIAQAAEIDPRQLRYISSNGGRDAMDRLKNGFGVAVVSGLGELLHAHRDGEVKIVGITSGERLPELNGIKTFREQGVDVEFANWRGYFAAPTLSQNKVEKFQRLCADLNASDTWAQTRRKYFWSEHFLTGQALREFLEAQNKLLQKGLRDLELLEPAGGGKGWAGR
ncbi:tripartite tricarboxylate transporter family receptor [Tamilnaduibacter salinus]|uniref:Tripartite tricarboxylate transporter family receptor n=1 Tax=Tamilnaduibacter salinus TaxID=1484056 RepID=A0A2U1CTT3_9GAMM|nr:tripartite tricarboxylate transporter substrate-binding protein [Tamilnaduibacter salinus]PVY70114.1 tripartite tricarboxylate transporter family receptor [Tamilnaduibacter salinus]